MESVFFYEDITYKQLTYVYFKSISSIHEIFISLMEYALKAKVEKLCKYAVEDGGKIPSNPRTIKVELINIIF